MRYPGISPVIHETQVFTHTAHIIPCSFYLQSVHLSRGKYKGPWV